MNKKNTDNLYRFFVTFSILICVFILPYISAVRSKLVDGDVGGNPANEYIVLEKADQIAVYMACFDSIFHCVCIFNCEKNVWTESILPAGIVYVLHSC